MTCLKVFIGDISIHAIHQYISIHFCCMENGLNHLNKVTLGVAFLHSTNTTHMVTYVTMSRTCWTCSKKAASKMHFMLLLTKTLRKISRVGAGAAELHNWSSAALHSWLNQIELWESSIFMLQCHNLVWLLLLMFSTIIVGRGLSPDSVPYSFGATTGFQSISAGILSFRRVSSQNPTQSQKAALFANTSQLPR